MEKKYTREQLMKFSNEEIMEKTKGKAIIFHLIDGRLTQLCVNDLQWYDEEVSFFYTKTNIKINLQDVEYIEVIDACSHFLVRINLNPHTNISN